MPSENRFPTPHERSHWLPLAHLNLQFNPFGELARGQRAEVAVVDIACWLPWLETDRHALQFIGDCGRGKTTHLLALQARLPHAAYVYLPEDGPCPEIPIGRPLLIDEAQRLPWRVRRRVFSRGGPIVLGTHVDLRSPLRRRGYSVQNVHVAASIDPARLAAILNRRIFAARLRAGPIPQICLEDSAALLARFGNNIRSIEGFLYDRIQQHAGEDGGQVRFID